MGNWDDLDLGSYDVSETAEVEDVDIEVPERTYTCTTDHCGNKDTPIAVKCANCAMWESSTAADDPRGKPLCRDGRRITVDLEGKPLEWCMRRDRWSCQQKFLPKEMTYAAKALPRNYGQALALKWLIPTIRASIKYRQRVRKWYAKHDPDGDPNIAIGQALTFLLDANSAEQLEYITPLISDFATILKTRLEKSKVRKGRFDRGDVVSWTDPDSKASIEGFVLSYNPREDQITIMVDQKCVAHLRQGVDHAIPIQYSLSDWKERFSPEVLRKAEAPLKSGTEE